MYTDCLSCQAQPKQLSQCQSQREHLVPRLTGPLPYIKLHSSALHISRPETAAQFLSTGAQEYLGKRGGEMPQGQVPAAGAAGRQARVPRPRRQHLKSCKGLYLLFALFPRGAKRQPAVEMKVSEEGGGWQKRRPNPHAGPALEHESATFSIGMDTPAGCEK